MKRRLVAIAALSAVVVGLALSCGVGGASEGSASAMHDDILGARSVSVIQPEARDFPRTIRTTGSLQPRREASIRALVEGTIVELPVDIGDHVEGGDLLFATRPDNARLAVASAEAALRTAEATLEDLRAWRRPEEVSRLEALVDAREAEAERLQAERERSRELYREGTISRSEWDAVRANAETARAQLVVATEDLAIAQAGPTGAELAVAEARVGEARAALASAQKQLEDTRIYAPFSGYVVARNEREGGYASRGDAILRLADISTLEAELYIPERFALAIHEGQEVHFTLQSNGQRVEGRIDRVNRALDRRTRNFMVKATVANPDRRIKAGSFAIGTVELEPLEDVLSLPAEAVLSDEGRPFVWVVEDDRAQRRALDVGERVDGRVAVLSGLESNDRVILDGRGAVSEGTAVAVR